MNEEKIKEYVGHASKLTLVSAQKETDIHDTYAYRYGYIVSEFESTLINLNLLPEQMEILKRRLDFNIAWEEKLNEGVICETI